jgi:flagellar hook-associated protein 1 FlgK
MITSTSILGSLRAAARSLATHQTAVDTAGHNLANVNTPGYSRERPELVPSPDRGGVDVRTIARIRDRFLDFSLLTEQQTLGKNKAQEGLLDRLQAVFNDPPGEGLSAQLDQLFQSFHDLSINPTDQGVRATVKDRGNRLPQTIQLMRSRIDQLKSDLTTEIRQRVTDANSYITQIADLNRQITGAQPSAPPNDLLDRRDALVTKLAQIVGVTATDRADGSVQLAMNGTGILLVDANASAPLAMTVNGATDAVDITAGGSAVVTPRDGALAGLLDARNLATGAVKQAVSDLDALASAIALQVNRLHTSGTGLTEYTSLTSTNAVTSSLTALTAAGLPFTPVTGSFKVIVHNAAGAVTANVTVPVTAGTTTLDDLRIAIGGIAGLSTSITGGKLSITAGAGSTFTFAGDTSDALLATGLNTFYTGSTSTNIALNTVIANDVTKIAAATADAAGLVHSGDGTNALAIARLRTKLTMAGSTQTFTDFYGSAVARVGSLKRDASEAVTRQEAAVGLVQGLQQQVSGVNTDEELVNLTQSQSAYAAAARYATTINSMLETLMNMAK